MVMGAGRNVIVRGDVLSGSMLASDSVVMTCYGGVVVRNLRSFTRLTRTMVDHHLGVVALVVTGSDSRSNTS